MPAEFLISPWGGLFWLLAALLSLAVHEFMHAVIAYSLGDQTPKSEGRVTLFPFPHLDPLGFVLLVLFGFGWAKPVRFEPSNLRYPNFGSTLVALAGPLSNAILIIFIIAVARLVTTLTGQPLSLDLVILAASFIAINSLLLVINLIPLPPFDGSKFLLDAIRWWGFTRTLDFIEKNGQYILIAFILIDNVVGPGLISRLISTTVSWAMSLLNAG